MNKTREVLAKYIPKNLEECFQWLDEFLNDKEYMFELTENSMVVESHHGLGQSLRNNWKLWEKSPLTEFFGKLGIFHADDMSGIIIRSYYRKSTGKPIDLEEQIKEYQDYWKENPPIQTVTARIDLSTFEPHSPS
jgi:hypothetical protein